MNQFSTPTGRSSEIFELPPLESGILKLQYEDQRPTS